MFPALKWIYDVHTTHTHTHIFSLTLKSNHMCSLRFMRTRLLSSSNTIFSVCVKSANDIRFSSCHRLLYIQNTVRYKSIYVCTHTHMCSQITFDIRALHPYLMSAVVHLFIQSFCRLLLCQCYIDVLVCC